MRRLVVLACLAACGDDTPGSGQNPPDRVALVTEDSKFLLSALDSKHVISTDEAATHVWYQAYEPYPGGEDARCGLSPDGRHVALLGWVDGSENDTTRLDVGDVSDTSVAITSMRIAAHVFGPQWSPDSQRIAYLAAEEPAGPTHLHIGDTVLANDEASSLCGGPIHNRSRMSCRGPNRACS